MRGAWTRPLAGLGPRASAGLWAASFIVPLLLWCAVSYLPFVWHPMVRVTDPGDIAWMTPGLLVEKPAFLQENSDIIAQKGRPATGVPSNPVFLPAPHQVAHALVTGFTTPPARDEEPWLHQSLWHSIKVILWGFLLSSIIGVPLGILCGAMPAMGRLTEPFIEFFRYLPAPAFGALAVAVLGIEDAPKVSIIFIGTFFQQVLVIANTTRKLDGSLLEAAQTLGARNKQLVFKVVIPGIVVDLYTDMRILLGWAWTYLVIAEVFGTTTGITFFLTQQSRYFHFAKVYAGIITIGIIGLTSDMLLAFVARRIFPWQPQSRSALGKMFGALLPDRLRRRPAAPVAVPPRLAA